MAVSAAYIVAPVFTASEIITFLLAGMAGKAGLRNRFGRLVFERDDLCRIAFLRVSLSRTMARFAACYLVFPGVDSREASVRSVGERLELILVTVLARVAADVFVVVCGGYRPVSPGDVADQS